MKRTREPIQVYLTEEERTRLERLAAALGVSRSEILRRGISALSAATPAAGPLADLVAEGLASPARIEAGDTPPPAGRPVAPLAELLAELRADRNQR
jgi:predicted ArsR family transcriptional regulator